MKVRRAQHRERGQAVPLIAVMLVVLFGMVALAVDVGNTYAEQRNIVRGTNAAALAGMNMYLSGGTDSDVRRAIEQSLITNGVQVTTYGQVPQAGSRSVRAQYLDASGSVISTCSEVGACGAQRVEGAQYIRVDVGGEVDTYFAKLFGTNSLPVNSTAFSKLGFCTSGLYPIAVRYSVNGKPTLDDERGFINHDGFYRDETYREPLTYKTLYLRDSTNPNGGFSLLRWKPDIPANNTAALARMLEGDGNILDGFAEAPWPDIPEGPAEYPGYPQKPGEFSGNEWVYGNDFALDKGNNPFSGPVLTQLEYHKSRRTLMTLPLYRFDNGDNANPSYYVETLGAFLLVDYGTDPVQGPWVKLAYVRKGGMCAMLETNPPPSNKLTLSGNVAYIPRYRMMNNTDRPIQFLVVLDVTGSMSWNFNGQGKIGGQVVQCAGTNNCSSGPGSAWDKVNERRIKIAKDVLEGFVNRMAEQSALRPHDVMRIVTFAGDFGLYTEGGGDDAAAVQSLTQVYPSNWSSNAAELKNAIRNAGAINGDPYLTDGSTPSAVGLARAAQVFATAPEKAPDGQRYRRVVIFVTDGVANVLRNGLLNDYNGCSGETVACQAGTVPPDDPNGILAPLSAMAAEGSSLYHNYVEPTGGEIYVVALGKVDQTGLNYVASASNYIYSAQEAIDLGKIFDDIQEDAIYGECKAGVGLRSETMSPATMPGPGDGFPDLVNGTVGFVYLTHTESGQQIPPVPIKVDETTGRLRYLVHDLPPGTYTMKAYIGHKPLEDRTARVYDLFVDKMPSANNVRVTVTPGAASLNGIVEYHFTLDMSTGPCGTQEDGE